MRAFDCLPPPVALLEQVRAQCTQPMPADLDGIAQAVHARLGGALVGLLVYGSCLRNGDLSDGMVDLYALVDSYAHAHPKRLQQLANAWLPPTVVVISAATPDGRMLHAKCAILSLQDFETGTRSWFQSYLWGRFAQPCRLVYFKDGETQRRIHFALAQAVMTLLGRCIAHLPDQFDSFTLWEQSLSLTYRTELRPESADRPRQLVRHDMNYYSRITQAAAPAVKQMAVCAHATDRYRNLCPPAARRRHERLWKLRRIQGRTLNVARLVKSFFTFENGVDYLVWKLERHLGEPIVVTHRLRRFPLVFGWPLLWRLLKSRRLR
ncbi:MULTISPECIES: hypothetical protein [unclassified Pseudomonas]|uniref:hypothetical protein n=1 Tax=unclassified Pseudomonas TaxID=196821 RepID=UPI000702559D|nr:MULTISPECIES: hypothetical protein [unclassified Pseudomonas]KQZ81568.1 hypothetical protein ASD60_10330 [Pseudomonas sp. Root562]